MRNRTMTPDDYRALSREYAQRALLKGSYYVPKPGRERRIYKLLEEIDEHSLGERLNEGLELLFYEGDE